MSIHERGYLDSEQIIHNLDSLPPRALNEVQLAIFQDKSLLQTRLAYTIDLTEISQVLQGRDNQRVIALSAGGSSLVRGDFVVERGTLCLVKPVQVLQQGYAGERYLDHITQIGEESESEGIPVGIAYAAAIDSDKRQILEDANLATLRQEIDQRFKGDVSRGVPTLSAFGTDSVMGLIAGMRIAKVRNFQVTEGIFFINGTGIGVAVYREKGKVGEIYITSAEYRPVITELIPVQGYRNGQACVDEIISGQAIEDMYAFVTQNHLVGSAISKLAQQGDPFAMRLYAQSAYIGAHVLIGVGREAFEFFTKPENTVIILEGSLCEKTKVPGYAHLLISTVAKIAGCDSTVVFPEEQPVIPSLVGAAIVAISKFK